MEQTTLLAILMWIALGIFSLGILYNLVMEYREHKRKTACFLHKSKKYGKAFNMVMGSLVTIIMIVAVYQGKLELTNDHHALLVVVTPLAFLSTSVYLVLFAENVLLLALMLVRSAISSIFDMASVDHEDDEDDVAEDED